jgi:hypothetical protein
MGVAVRRLRIHNVVRPELLHSPLLQLSSKGSTPGKVGVLAVQLFRRWSGSVVFARWNIDATRAEGAEAQRYRRICMVSVATSTSGSFPLTFRLS